VRLRGGRADRRVVPAKVLVIQARVETLRDGLCRVPGPRDRAVQPVVEDHERSVRGCMPGFRGSHGVARYAARARTWAWNFAASDLGQGLRDEDSEQGLCVVLSCALVLGESAMEAQSSENVILEGVELGEDKGGVDSRRVGLDP